MSPLEALLQLLPLDRLPRTGWALAGVPTPESVAAHSLGTAFVALALGPRVEPPLDVERAVALAVVHDAGEALTGDLPRSGARLLPEGAKREMDLAATRAVLGPLSESAGALGDEYETRGSREARFVALCDALHLGIRLVGYLRSGSKGLEDFRGGLERLDCGEFEPCETLRRDLLAELQRLGVPAAGSPAT